MTVSEQSRRDRCFLCASPTAGQASGEAEGDTPADAGAAVDGGAVAQTGPVQAGGREEEPRRVHEEERRVHKPAGAGAREVSAPIRRQSSQKWAAGPPMNIVTETFGDIWSQSNYRKSHFGFRGKCQCQTHFLNSDVWFKC